MLARIPAVSTLFSQLPSVYAHMGRVFGEFSVSAPFEAIVHASMSSQAIGRALLRHRQGAALHCVARRPTCMLVARPAQTSLLSFLIPHGISAMQPDMVEMAAIVKPGATAALAGQGWTWARLRGYGRA